jgi:hypothetical protein
VSESFHSDTDEDFIWHLRFWMAVEMYEHKVTIRSYADELIALLELLAALGATGFNVFIHSNPRSANDMISEPAMMK